MELLFYDIECFEYDSLVIFKDINDEIVGSFWNCGVDVPADERGKVFAEIRGCDFGQIHPLVSKATIVGYNNYSYDDVMLSCMMNMSQTQFTLHALNNSIIRGLSNSRKVSPDIHSLDTMQQIDVAFPSLKQIEGNMGRSIVESDIPFDIDRPLTAEERKTVEAYCSHDVSNTIEVYKLRKESYFDIKDTLLGMLPGNSKGLDRVNTTTLSAKILLGNGRLPRWRRVPDELETYFRNVDGIDTDVWDMWEEATQDRSNEPKDKQLPKGLSRTKTDASHGIKDCVIVFGLGGLHGAPKLPGVYHNVKLADVGSMYPSIIKKLNALGTATDLYDQMRIERLHIKKSDPVRATALKLILNSVYGNFKNQYSDLFNPIASTSVCIYGQIAIFKLSKALADEGYQIININTDGVAFVDNGEGDYEAVCRRWEQEFDGLSLEVDEFTKWIQKDVNNYIAVTPSGHIKTKGGETNKYSENLWFKNNSCRIIQMALVDYLLKNNGADRSMLRYLSSRKDEPLLWQYILKAGGTYLRVENSLGEKCQNVNRVFAVTDKCPNITKLYKVRQDGGLVNFPDVPERMAIFNEDLSSADFYDRVGRYLDIEHYYHVIMNKLEGWPDVR